MQPTHRRQVDNILFIVIAVTAAHLLFALLADKSLLAKNPYHSYSLQAVSWLQGRLDLGQDYPWLELAVYKDRYFVSFPPFPSYILLPFCLLFGPNTPDTLLALATALTGAVFAYRILKHFCFTDRAAVFFTLFLYLGTNLWQITVDGWVWFFAQNLSFTCSLISIYCALRGKAGLSLFLLACAIGCRPFQVLYLPLILVLLRKSDSEISLKQWCCRFIRIWYKLLPAGLLIVSYLLLNYLRFDNPFEFGHHYLPEFQRVPQGQFSLFYLPENLCSLIRTPVHFENGALFYQMFDGSNIFLVIPFFTIYLYLLLRALWRKNLSVPVVHGLTGALILLHILFLCCHKTMGGAHFGNRYLLDTLPFLFLLTASVLKDRHMDLQGQNCSFHLFESISAVALSIFSFGLNFTGTIALYAWLAQG